MCFLSEIFEISDEIDSIRELKPFDQQNDTILRQKVAELEEKNRALHIHVEVLQARVRGQDSFNPMASSTMNESGVAKGNVDNASAVSVASIAPVGTASNEFDGDDEADDPSTTIRTFTYRGNDVMKQ